MTSIAKSLAKVRREIDDACLSSERSPSTVSLLAVSKTRSAAEVQEAIDNGQLDFGENYLQDALEKIDQLEYSDLRWHFIGPIQSNKTRPIAEKFSWVHSVDRLKIARRLSEQRPHYAEPLNLCIQVNVSEEASKSGCSIEDLPGLAREIAALPKVKLRGLMAIPEATDNQQRLIERFKSVRELFEMLKAELPELDTLSMGMSADLQAAISQGSTIVRVGTAIFGPRPPKSPGAQ